MAKLCQQNPCTHNEHVRLDVAATKTQMDGKLPCHNLPRLPGTTCNEGDTEAACKLYEGYWGGRLDGGCADAGYTHCCGSVMGNKICQVNPCEQIELIHV